jgi:hypothetical protein
MVTSAGSRELAGFCVAQEHKSIKPMATATEASRIDFCLPCTGNMNGLYSIRFPNPNRFLLD